MVEWNYVLNLTPQKDTLMINVAELEASILSYVKENDSAKTMTFTEFYENINKIHSCERSELAITLSLMDMLNKIRILKDSSGKGIGFLPPESPKSLGDDWETP